MKRGDRVELIRMGDDPHPLEPGCRGTVTCMDALGTIHVQWDNGRTLGLLPDAGDEYRLLSAEEE